MLERNAQNYNRVFKPFLQASYVQRGHGLLDWFRTGWNSISSLYRNKIHPNLLKAASSTAAQELKRDVSNFAKDQAIKFGVDTLTGSKTIPQAATDQAKEAINKGRKRLAYMLEQEAKINPDPLTPKTKRKIRPQLLLDNEATESKTIEKGKKKKSKSAKNTDIKKKKQRGRGITKKKKCNNRQPLV